MKKTKFWLKTLYAIFKATAFDVAIGLFVAHMIVKLFDHTSTGVTFYLFGIFFALLPDFDTIFQFFGEKVYADHRSWPHYPSLMFLIVLPLVSTWSYFSQGHISYTHLLLASVSLLWHYLHDSWDNAENEEGIQWGAPFFSFNRYVISIKPVADTKKSWLMLTRALVRKVTDNTLQRINEKKETAMEFWEKYYMKETLDAYRGVIILVVSILFVWTV